MTKTLKNVLFALGLAAAIPAAMAQPDAGDWEFTLGGGGGSDSEFRTGSIGVNGSFGYFVNQNLEVALRQNVSFVDAGRDEEWAGSTRVAADWHFLLGKFVPFVGASFGLDYNEDGSAWGIGPEVGVKYYVYEKTFIFAMGEYRWMFDRLRQVDNNLDDGRFAFVVGVGFNIGGRR
jgi:hypothetical protein